MRAVQPGDLEVFFEQQLDPQATRMAAFPSRARDVFMAHWAKILAGPNAAGRTMGIVYQGRVAGNVCCWKQEDEWRVGYWLGREFWGRGIASAALGLLLGELTTRPLHARVVKHNLASIRVLQKNGFVIVDEEIFPIGDGKELEEFILTLPA